MGREVLLEDVVEHHELGGYVLGTGEGGAAQGCLELALPPAGGVRDGVAATGCGLADAKEAGGDGVEVGVVEVVEVAFSVDEDAGLEGLLGAHVVADAVVREVVKDLEGEEEAGRGNGFGPVEDGPVDDLDVLPVAALGGGGRRRR